MSCLELPNLAPIIINYLSVPISGQRVERSFSHLNNVLIEGRTNLKVENLVKKYKPKRANFQ